MLLAALLATAAPTACTLENARPATVREMAAAPDEWLGRCVRMEGYSTGNTFYQDVAGRYRSDATDQEDRPNDGWLGLDLREKGAYRRRPLRARVAGRVHDCGADYAHAEATLKPGEMVFMRGYCHSRGGLLLRDVTIRHGGPAVPVRQVGDKARLEFGDLLMVDEAGPPPAEPLELLSRFVAAVRAGDAVTASSLAHGYNRNVREDPKSRALWGKFLTSDGPFAFLRKAPKREPVFFRERQSREDVENRSEPDWFACSCATPDCAQIWPIAVKDTAADADPAYACVRLFRDFSEGRPWRVGLDLRKPRSFTERD